MADLKQYTDTAVNFGDAEKKEKVELLFTLGAIGNVLIVAPLVYVATESVFIFSAVAVVALVEVAVSQYLPEKMFDDPSHD